MTLRVAVASADGLTLPREHFGAVPAFRLFDLDPEGPPRPVGEVANPTGGGHAHHHDHHHEHGHHHGNQGKARQILAALKAQGVQVVVSRAYGPNIKRLATQLVPVLIGAEGVDEVLSRLQAHWAEIEAQHQAGDARRHVILR